MNSAILTLRDYLKNEDLWDQTFTAKKGEVINDVNKANTNLYFIEKGCVRMYFVESEKDHIVNFGFKDSLVLDLESFTNEITTDLIIEAINKTQVYVISKRRLMKTLKSEYRLINLWSHAMTEIALKKVEREKDLLLDSPGLRFERTLKRIPQLFQQVPHKYIASYLRMSPETLSRLQNS